MAAKTKVTTLPSANSLSIFTQLDQDLLLLTLNYISDAASATTIPNLVHLICKAVNPDPSQRKRFDLLQEETNPVICKMAIEDLASVLQDLFKSQSYKTAIAAIRTEQQGQGPTQ